jgi:hypothetical protein
MRSATMTPETNIKAPTEPTPMIGMIARSRANRTARAASREVHDERFAVARGHEGAELRPGQADALGVCHGVEVELFGAEEGFVDDEGDVFSFALAFSCS